MRKLPNFDPYELPQELQKYRYFCLCKETSKAPFNPKTGRMADSTDKSTFADLQTTLENADGYYCAGMGIFDEWAAIDIDHCIENGSMTDFSADIVRTMKSYTEVSPSGTGIRIVFKTSALKLDADTYKKRYYINNRQRGLEIYIAGITNKYVRLTGNRLNDYGAEERSSEVAEILDKYMKLPEQNTRTASAAAPVYMTDSDILERARNAANGSAFCRLYDDGEFSSFPSQSEADQSLCNMLAYWLQGDTERIDAAFRRSALMRDKWNKNRSYRESTIRKAIASCSTFYDPEYRSVHNIERLERIERSEMNETSTGQAPNQQKQAKKSSIELFDAFIETIQTEAYKPIKTGLQPLDRLLGGGFDPQSLVMIGAAPAMGKTTLAQQIFETMAANGTQVIFLNLEMSREQLLSRSISRAVSNADPEKPMTAAQVIHGYEWTDEQRNAVIRAAAAYRKNIAPFMHYNPDGTAATLDAIQETLKQALESTPEGQSAPVVVLDYLQLVQSKGKEDPQENIKAVCTALKGYAIKGQTVACAILAFNRDANKNGKVTLESGRDTSAIEYSADTMLGLNYTELEDGTAAMSDIDTLKQATPRSVSLKLLKKRMTADGGRLDMLFNGKTSTFFALDTIHEQKRNRRESTGFIHFDT